MSVKRTLGQKGAVLIVVLGVLVVLALLATTFANLQTLDRSVSRNYTDDVRAKLAAQSGVEYAISQIREMMTNGFFSPNSASKAWIYWGSDTTESGINPALMQVPIELAKNPSWAWEDEAPQNPTNATVTPKLINIRRPDGNVAQVGFTSAMESGHYASYGDLYTLRVVDSSGLLYVNDGLYQYGGNNSTVSANLRRILNNVGKHPSVGIPGLGDNILNNRGSGYTNKYELRKAVNYDDAQFNKFKDLVTTHAWVDKNVVNPVPLSAQMLNDYPIQYWRGNANPIYRRGRGMNQWWQNMFAAQPLMWFQPGNSNLNHNGVYGYDELFPQYIEVVWRAPVNVNTAPEPLLTALIADVAGFFMIERRRFTPYAGSPASFGFSGQGYGGSQISGTIPQQYYTWHYVQQTFDATGTGGDEIGNLYKTAPFYGPWGGTGSGGVSAQVVSQHVIACRSKSTYGGVDYATQPFGGPFKSWAQFYAFLDFLVEKQVIWDSRAYFGDYATSPMPTGTPVYSQAPPANSAPNRFASYAMADALKANFNPNCNLNETNPDRNLYLRVDKTDLIVNSTEFCFTPVGYYEIESLGRVLRPEGSGQDVLAPGTTCTVVAEKKILVSVKVYDAYRESTQRHFYSALLDTDVTTGLALRQTNPETNNNRSMEIGPEVDNGPLVYGDNWGLSQSFVTTPAEDGYAGYTPGVTTQNTGWGYEYGGYLALPTLGGNLLAANSVKPPGTLWTTPAGGAQFGSVIHSHFTWDFMAHHHQSAIAHGNDWFRDELGSVLRYANSYIDQLPYSRPAKIERALNFNDRNEPILSPYGPTYGIKYRLARSFRMPMQPTGTGTSSLSIPVQEFAPSDLRIDGAYSERHSGIAYWMDQGHSWNEQAGILCAWVKPSFYPEHTGKMRKVFGMSRWHAKNYSYRNPNLWDMFYMPAHDTLPHSTPYPVSNTESQGAAYIGSPYSTCSDHPPESTGGKGVYPFRPMSFNTTWGTHCYDGSLADMWDEGPWMELENYSCTPSLNHRLHGGAGEATKPNYLDHGKWTHVTLWWNETVGSYVNTQAHTLQTYINGSVLGGSTNPAAGTIFTSSYKKKYFTIQSFSDSATGKWLTNTVRLGEVSSHGFGTFNRNYSADMTFDEFYVWKDNSSGSLSNAIQLWQRGRYYKPKWDTINLDGSFTSRAINLNQVSPPRFLAPPTTVNPPMTTGSSSTTTTVPSAAAAPKRRLLGVSWTWFAEDYLKTGNQLVPIMYNHQNPASPIPMFQTESGNANDTPVATARVFILAKNQTYPLDDSTVDGYKDDGFSKIMDKDANGNLIPLELSATEAENIKYRVWFKIKGFENESVRSSAILLATPVFEDVTLFFDQGDVEFLLYALVNTV